MKLKAGHGYFETGNYPIGGCFRRADKVQGKEIKDIIRRFDKYFKGCNWEVRFMDDTTGAINSTYVED